MKNINIAEILKHCPEGIHLYSPICGKCTFDSLNKGTIICITQNDQKITFTSEGYYMLPVFEDSECVLFPSKENRDWNTIRYFKDADIVASTIPHIGTWVGIFKQYTNNDFESYCSVSAKGVFNNIGLKNHSLVGTRLASEEEQQKLFQAIKDNGYKWNDETKILEKLIETEFKVGDRIRNKTNTRQENVVTEIRDTHYILDDELALPFISQDQYELVPNKFDITTLKPFESRVLVRDTNTDYWEGAFYSHYKPRKFYTIGNSYYYQCIPYKGNEHLLDTTKDCDDFYKTW